jgi:hypothetical protein
MSQTNKGQYSKLEIFPEITISHLSCLTSNSELHLTYIFRPAHSDMLCVF